MLVIRLYSVLVTYSGVKWRIFRTPSRMHQQIRHCGLVNSNLVKVEYSRNRTSHLVSTITYTVTEGIQPSEHTDIHCSATGGRREGKEREGEQEKRKKNLLDILLR